ncbi:hypothetical protein KXX32_009303 [Aspergillus fumigatus]|nr:hypothetical protein KXX32_009303 [Aspergillus fumigatus]
MANCSLCKPGLPQSGQPESVYADFKLIHKCKETMFYDFSLFDDVDDQDGTHRIQACSSYGPDFASLPASTARIASAESVDVEFELGWWYEGFGLAASGCGRLLSNCAGMPRATIGLCIGQGLLNQGLSESALRLFQDNLDKLEVSTPTQPSLFVHL